MNRSWTAVGFACVGLAVAGCQTTGTENLGDTTFNQGLHNEAIEHYDRDLAVQPDSAKAYTSRGNVFAVRGHYDRAIDHYNQAIRLDSKLDLAYARRADAYYSRGSYDAAVADYNQAISLGNDEASVYSNRDQAVRKLHEQTAIKPTRRVSPTIDRTTRVMVPTRRSIKRPVVRHRSPAPMVKSEPKADTKVQVRAAPITRSVTAGVARKLRLRKRRASRRALPSSPIEAVKFADEHVAEVEQTGDVMAISIDVGEFQSSPHYVKTLASALSKILPVARQQARGAKEYRILGIATLQYSDGRKARGPVMSFTLPRDKVEEIDFENMQSNRILDYTSLEVSAVGRKLIVGYCSDDNWLLELLQASAVSLEVLGDMYRWFLPKYSSDFCLVNFPNAPVRAEAVLLPISADKLPAFADGKAEKSVTAAEDAAKK